MAPASSHLSDLGQVRTDSDPDDTVVVNRPPSTASEWEVLPLDCLLSADVPAYPAGAAVIVVCYVDDLLEDGRRTIRSNRLNAHWRP